MARKVRRVSMYTFMALMLFATVLFLVGAVASYERRMDRNAEELVQQRMTQRVQTQASSLCGYLRDVRIALEEAASELSGQPDEAALEALSDQLELSDLSYEIGADAAAQDGATMRLDGDRFVFTAPTGDGQGVLVGRLHADALGERRLLNASANCLIRSDGLVLAAAPESPMHRYVGVNIFETFDAGSVAEDMLAGRTDSRLVATTEGDSYVAYAPVGEQNDLYIFQVVSYEQAHGDFAFIGRVSRRFELELALGALVLFALAGWFFWEKNRKLRAEKLRLEWSEERYLILAEDSKEVFWEFDMQSCTFRLGENFRRLYGGELTQTLDQFLEGVHPDERERASRVFSMLISGASADLRASLDMRLRVGEGKLERYVWCRAHMSVLFDERRRRSLIIGKLTDISQEKLNTERLELRARTDALTGLLNRAGLEEAIRARFAASGQRPCAVALLDIDDFKEINDFYGHDMGDDVLRALADFLRRHFRGTDIVGRLGGDEFMALMEGVDDRDRLSHALTRLRLGLSQLHVGEIRVGCSVGAVLSPEGDDSFEALYKSADVALYQAKRSGKGRYTIYASEGDVAVTLQDLEHSPFAAYVVDPNTRELLFANAQMCARFPNLRPGEKCHCSLMDGAQTPCEGCDLPAELDRAQELDGQETAAGTLCGEWLRATISHMRWPDGRDALLFSCRASDGVSPSAPAQEEGA